jgi:cell division protein FtsI (penicillin-binding protein 3)
MLYNAIANKGLMMKPFMVKEIRKDGKVLETINPSIYQKAIANEKTCKSLNQFLEAVTEKGTAKSVFKDCKFPVAGKTGTARISKTSSGYSGNYLVSFAGYFPSDQPVYSIVVVINSPKKGGISGARVAAPVFKEIADKIYSTHLQIQPELLTGKRKDIPKVLNGNRESILELNREFNIPVIDKSDKNKWINTKEKSRNIIISPKKIQPNKIPDFRGLGIKDAFELARELKLELHFNGYGRIVTQNIKPGTRYRDGRSIFVELKP